jgi:hypothetical protein
MYESILLDACTWNFNANFFFILQGTNLHIDLRHYFIGALMKLPDQDTYKLEQRVKDILAEWDQLLLNDVSGYRWARTSPELCDFSLVYVSRSKSHGERYVSVHTAASPN